MTLMKNARGVYEGDFRATGMPRLHLSMRTTKITLAKKRHAAVLAVYRLRQTAMAAQLKSGALTVERVEQMVANNEPLLPLTAPVAKQEARWGTVDQAVDRYIAWIAAHPKRAEATGRNVKYQLQKFRNFEFEGERLGTLSVAAVTSKMVEAYQRSFIDAGTSVNSISNDMVRVAALWNWLNAQETRSAREQRRRARLLYSPVDPDLQVRETKVRDRVLTELEAQDLLAATPSNLLFPIGCALLAGLRLNEVLHLRPGLDVDLDTGTLAIQKQPTWKPKTKRSVRVVPMAPALAALAAKHGAQYASSAWMLPGSNDPTVPLNDLTFRQQFMKVVVRAGIGYGRDVANGVTFHTLRHTFASHAVMRGVDLYTVAQLLGDSLKMVEEVYAHLSKDHKLAAIAKVAAAFKLPEAA